MMTISGLMFVAHADQRTAFGAEGHFKKMIKRNLCRVGTGSMQCRLAWERANNV